jgi:hypothetical protein
MSFDINMHVNHIDITIATRIRKVWDYQSFTDKTATLSFSVKSDDGDEVTIFCNLEQLEQIGVEIDRFIASAVDPLPEPTVNDLAKSQAESEQGWSLA